MAINGYLRYYIIYMSIKEHPPQPDSGLSGNELHVPVLLDATLDQLHPIQDENYLDLTAGYGGHAKAFLAKTENYKESVLVDRDDQAIKYLDPLRAKGVHILHTDFVTAAQSLSKEGKQFDIVVVDLGVSSPQLDQGERGFSLRHDGPLDMRMDRRQPETAATLVNTLKEDDLAKLICDYGEEPLGFARRIAAEIVRLRPLSSTQQLANLVAKQYRGGWKKTHPATRTFQALRIAVNREILQINQLLPYIPGLLKPGGRVGIISFHSLEDRLIKNFFKDQKDSGLESQLQILTKKPISGATHDAFSPRSRSAKLRVAVKKIKQKRKGYKICQSTFQYNMLTPKRPKRLLSASNK